MIQRTFPPPSITLTSAFVGTMRPRRKPAISKRWRNSFFGSELSSALGAGLTTAPSAGRASGGRQPPVFESGRSPDRGLTSSALGAGFTAPTQCSALGAGLTTQTQIPRWARVSRPRPKSRAGRGSHDPDPNRALGPGLTNPHPIPRWARVSRPRPKSLTDRSPSFGVNLASTNTFEAGVCGERGRPVGRVPRRARESLPLPVSPGYRPVFRDGNRTDTGTRLVVPRGKTHVGRSSCLTFRISGVRTSYPGRQY
jgi:hypothetical protein